MDLLHITCFLGLLPALYPLGKLIHKKDINLFDLIILFHTLNFMAVPLWKGNLKNWSDDGIMYVFLYYMFFAIVMLAIDIWWHIRFGGKRTPINISKYLQHFNGVVISKTGVLFFVIVFVIAVVFYMPRATYILELEDAGLELDPSEKTPVFVFGNIFTLSGIALILNFVYSLKCGKIKNIGNAFLVLYLILNLFFPRRVFLTIALELLFCIYAVYREVITIKLMAYITLVSLLLYFFYFPFYNIMRQGAYEVKFNPNEPVKSMCNLATYAWNNWGTMSGDATEASDERSLNLYDAIYDLMKYKALPQKGELTQLAIDVSIPRFLNPSKANGSQPVLEEMTKHYNDQADSFLLFSFGEFHYFGAIYTIIIYSVVFILYSIYGKMWNSFFGCFFPQLYVAFLLFGLTWNVEATPDGLVSWFFSSFPVFAMLVLLEKQKVLFVLPK